MQKAEMKQVSLHARLSISKCSQIVRLPVVGKSALPLVKTCVQLHRHGVVLVLLV
jgi:hypothetical protein